MNWQDTHGTPLARSHPPRRLPWLLVLGVCMLPQMASAADANKAHDHTGKVKPYTVPPKSFPLTEAEKADLAGGKAIRKTLRGDSGGRGLAVIDIAAPPDVVWSCIVDYPRYPVMVDNVKEVEVYERQKDHIKARFVLSGAGMSIEYFVDHIYRPKAGYLTWTLDYTRSSDLDDSVGFWRVSAHPDKEGHTRLYYSIDLRVGWWVPGFVENMLAKDGLTKSTEWVKREAEKKVAKKP
jgi:ribosome-associated toxin RatA of RatAB toxin-antitoxin module